MSTPLENATFLRCRTCERPIDVWKPPGLRIAPDETTGRHTLTRVDPVHAVCPDCLIAATPKAEREIVATVYAVGRIVRAEVGVPPDVTLLVLHSRGSESVPWAKEFGLILYGVQVSGDAHGMALPRMSFAPDDPTEPPISFVWLAGDVANDHVSLPFLHFRWSFLEPERPARLEVIGWDAEETDRASFAQVLNGAAFFREFTAKYRGGRPLGRTDRDERWYRDHYREMALELRRPPTQQEFLNRHRLDRKTLRANLQQFGLWPWSNFKNKVALARTIRL